MARLPDPTRGSSAQPLRTFLECTLVVFLIVAISAMSAWVWFLQGQLAHKDEQLAAITTELPISPSAGPPTVIDVANALRHKTEEQRQTIDHLMGLQRSLSGELAAYERQVDALLVEREAAQALIAALKGDGDEAAVLAAEVALRTHELQVQRAEAARALSALQDEHALDKRSLQGLRVRVTMLESTLERVRSNLVLATSGLRGMVDDQLADLSDALAGAGLDAPELVEQVGSGGPFVPWRDEAPSPTATLGLDEAFHGEIERLARVREVFAGLPVAAPLRDYGLSSRFGARRDPISGRRAMHQGLDFVARDSLDILSTAPGRVVRAGRVGSYGKMVEIEHGYGMTTRYAHLHRVTVRRGQTIERGQKIGIMGNTGRSTGRHLHYEIRVDDKPIDPARLLSIGVELERVSPG